MSQVFGTADILISWSMPSPRTLRGPGQTFYVQIFYNGTLQGEVQVDELSVFVNASDGVVNGRVQNIAVSYVCSVKIYEQTIHNCFICCENLTSHFVIQHH